MEQIQEIVHRLKEANKAYREGQPIMEDREYDELEHTLHRLDPTNDWFSHGVHEVAPKSRKVKLPFSMMSLNKVKTVEELIEWARNYNSDLVITPKLDGLSVGMKNQGEKAFTRGDGQIGQDCSLHLSAVSSCLDTTKLQGNDIVRGEIIFTHAGFAEFKKLHPEAKNSRNSATGLINSDFDVNRKEDYSNLSILCYSLIGSNKSKSEQLTYLNSLCPNEETKMPYIICKKSELDDMSKNPEMFKEILFKLFTDWKKTFPIDGLVFDVNKAELRQGECANGNPQYAIAYKDPDFTERGDTTIDHIELQINKDGVATPVVVLAETLNLSGADVSRVNGINMNYVHDWGLLDAQRVTIVRSGEVIPKIVAVDGIQIPFRDSFSSDKEYQLAYESALRRRHIQPTYQAYLDLVAQADWACPHCGRILHWDENHVQMYCPNEQCSERKLQSIVNFCKIIGIKNFGEQCIRQLFEEGLIEDFCDLFTKLQPEQLKGLEGWADTSIKALFAELKRVSSGNVCFAQVAHASGYFGGLGQKTIQKIVDTLPENFVVDSLTIEQLTAIPGIQEITARDFIDGFHIFVQKGINKVIKTSYFVSPTPTEGKLSGMKVCFTGFRDANLRGQIESYGGQVIDSLAKDTTCLVTRDIESNSSKVKNARKWGIEILTPDDFVKKYL